MGFFDDPFDEEQKLLLRAARHGKFDSSAPDFERIARARIASNRIFIYVGVAFALMGVIISASIFQQRSLGMDKSLALALAPLVFTLGGVAIIAAIVSQNRSMLARARQPVDPSRFIEDTRPRELDVSAERRSSVRWGIGFALFLDAIAVTLGVISAKFIAQGQISLVFLFALIFTGLGALVTYNAIASLIALNNPFPVLRIRPATPRLGDKLEISWSFAGRTGSVQGMAITLEGKEEATVYDRYRSGTRERTIDHIFASLAVLSEIPLSRERGRAEIEIPRDWMHSFEGESAKIIWTLRVRTNVANKPDSDDEMPITIGPRR